jgi:hypothetical protein
MEPSLLEPQSVATFPSTTQPTFKVPMSTSKPGDINSLLDAFSSDPFGSSSVLTTPTVPSSSAGDPFDELLSIASRPQNNIYSDSESFVGSMSYTQPMAPLQPNFGQVNATFALQQEQSYSKNTTSQMYPASGASVFPMAGMQMLSNPGVQGAQQQPVSNITAAGKAPTSIKEEDNPFDLF